MNHPNVLLISMLNFLLLQICISKDSININETVTDGDVLVSRGKTFALGFFSPGNSSHRYIGIWYNNVPGQTIVWVANRDNPINGTFGVLSINSQGDLVLQDERSNVPVWSTNVTASSTSNFIAQLLDSGNFVLVQEDNKNVIWQSFDYPTHTMLANMKLGFDRKTGLNRALTSWKSVNDPGTGDWSFRLEQVGSPEPVIYKGQVRTWRGGPWNGLRWSGIPDISGTFIIYTTVVINNDESTVIWGTHDPSIISRFYLDETGILRRSTWYDRDRRWIEFWNMPEEPCDSYGSCGPNGNCDPYNSEVYRCTCLPGYEPKFPNDWKLRDGSGGCVRKHGALTCGNGEGFVKVANAKVPDTSMARVNMSLNLKECQQECLRNCSCTAYAPLDVIEGRGCLIWHGDLTDTRVFTDAGQDLYIRVDAAELALYRNKKNFLAKKGMVVVLVTSSAVVVLIISILYWLVKWRRCGHPRKEYDEIRDPNLPVFDVNEIIAATDNFFFGNKIGQGGFGSVYKGRLANGKEIAVKRLSMNSRQGINEFKNEVKLISKLQHKNLVRLFGCCIDKEEKMLVYEYLPNKSLDFFIFDQTRRSLLDWSKRFHIIVGIARGIMYLHQDSRLRIIHRDLKSSNILLDAEMNPKISDFGMARIFEEDQIQGKTDRVVGTYGYMSPEYAVFGKFSEKSDVFSFGVMLLEILSGNKNSDFYGDDPSLTLIGYAWELWKEDRALEIVDSFLKESYLPNEALRCIQIGLLCVQEDAMDRPTMLAVVLMLSSEIDLTSPKQPAFVFRKSCNNTNSQGQEEGQCSVNEMTITAFATR